MSTTVHQNPAIANAIQADRRQRRDKKVDAWLRFAIQVVGVFVRGWWLMLGVGLIHHEWIAACPTISYGVAVGIAALIGSALVVIPTPKK